MFSFKWKFSAQTSMVFKVKDILEKYKKDKKCL